MKILAYGIGLLIVGAAIIILVQDVLLPVPESPSTVVAILNSGSSTSLTGTLTYYPNNVGAQIPYLVYRNPSGTVATRALIFGSGSDCETASGRYPCTLIKEALPAYYGTQVVHAEGILEDENLLVSTLAPA